MLNPSLTKQKSMYVNHTKVEHARAEKLELPEFARIVLIKVGGIGDFVLMTSAIHALRERYPLAQIDCITSGDKGKSFLEGLHLLNDIFVLEKSLLKVDQQLTLAQSLSQMGNLRRLLRSKHYDAALCFNHFLPADLAFLSALMIVTGAKYRVGLDCGTTGKFLHVKVPDAGFGAKHEVEYRIAVVEALGAVARKRQPFIPINAQLREQARSILAGIQNQCRKPVIAMHPGCHYSFPARRWLPERFSRLINCLYQKFGGQFVLLGGPEEAVLRDQILTTLETDVPRLNLSGLENIFLTAAIIEQCDLFIGNDSGLMHVAAAVNVPTLGIFGPTNPQAWAPYMPDNAGDGHVVFQDVPCRPCHYVGLHSGDGLGCATRHCLLQLSVETVAEAACQLLTARAF